MKTLIVEDSSTLCAIYKAYLDGMGLDVYTVETLSEALLALDTLKPELILLDIELPDGSGLDLLAETCLMDPAPAVVVMTGHGIELAEASISRGASDFLCKPFDASRLRVTLINAAKKLELSQKLSALSVARAHLGGMLGSSPVMQAVYGQVDALASGFAPVFITGERGTGKKLVARVIHDLSARAPGELVTLDCAAIHPELIESELLGEIEAARGQSPAREGLMRLANGGTLLLNEVCDMSYESQSALLRFIQNGTAKPIGSDPERTSDVHVIALTSRDPLFEMQEGRLHEDLFHQLHVVPLRMPALRERGNDIYGLAEHFMTRFAEQEHRGKKVLSKDAYGELKRYPWPGNVSQLESVIHRLTVMTTGDVIECDQVRTVIVGSDCGDNTAPRNMSAVSSERREGIEPLWVTEKHAIQSAIDRCDGDIHRASTLLEIAPSTIYRKIQSWKESCNA